jgi:hypothetical protein
MPEVKNNTPDNTKDPSKCALWINSTEANAVINTPPMDNCAEDD